MRKSGLIVTRLPGIKKLPKIVTVLRLHPATFRSVAMPVSNTNIVCVKL